MIKGYLGDVCFNGKLLKNHIIYTGSDKRIEKIAPFLCESQGIILCDEVLVVIKSEIADRPQKIACLKNDYNNSKSYPSFFRTSSYLKYGATEIKGATFIEVGNAKPINNEDLLSEEKISESKSYKTVVVLSRVMDKYYLDPILGFIPIVGDIIPPLCSAPALYVAAVKIKSLPLLLAIIYNILFDTVIGMIPFFIGNIIDFYNKAHIRNLNLIIGFVNNNKKVIREVNRKALLFTILIAVTIIAIVYMIKIAIYSALIIKEFIISLF